MDTHNADDARLHSARVEDLAVILAWLPDATTCRRWAGPQVPFAASPKATWSAMEAEPETTFILVDDENAILAFGQALTRDAGTVHLARLIVDPARRGQGVGRTLCRRLIEKAVRDFRACRLTLNVYADNHKAVALYRSLGFVEIDDDVTTAVIAMEYVIH